MVVVVWSGEYLLWIKQQVPGNEFKHDACQTPHVGRSVVRRACYRHHDNKVMMW